MNMDGCRITHHAEAVADMLPVVVLSFLRSSNVPCATNLYLNKTRRDLVGVGLPPHPKRLAFGI